MQPSLFRRWRRLTGSERRLLVEAWLLLALTKVGLIAMPFGLLRGLLDRYGDRSTARNVTPEHTAWAVAAAARRLPAGATCLTQALACNAMLRRRGYATRLRIGAAREGTGRIAAHAWVEMDDRVVMGELEDLGRFAPLLRPPT